MVAIDFQRVCRRSENLSVGADSCRGGQTGPCLCNWPPQQASGVPTQREIRQYTRSGDKSFILVSSILGFNFQVTVPLLETLVTEMRKATDRNLPFNFSHYIMICKLFKTKSESAQDHQVNCQRIHHSKPISTSILCFYSYGDIQSRDIKCFIIELSSLNGARAPTYCYTFQYYTPLLVTSIYKNYYRLWCSLTPRRS